MDTLGKLAAPATAKIRQLQKIVQDIKKNDGSLLDKIKRLKSKPSPKVPARDYKEDDREGDGQLSDPDYDNDTYEDPQDDSYEPPPSHRVFSATPSASFPRGEYLDSCHDRPNSLPRKPLRPGKASKQLPPAPTRMASDEEDYISPDGCNDDDNYIEPTENPPARMDHSRLMASLPEFAPNSDFYEFPDKEENSSSLPESRLGPKPTAQSQLLPPKPSPRLNLMRSPPTVQEPSEDEYEVCDPQDSSSNKPANGPPILPKPLPRERSPKPPIRLRPDLKPKDFESRTLPLTQTDHKTSPKAFSLDLKRPKIPLPPLTSPKQTDRGNVSADNRSTDQDKDADISKKPWYASTCDRKTADDALFHLNIDGAFMVRRSSGQDAQQPYTLVVFYKGRVYNIPIRFIPATKQYALGRQKKGEEYFSSVSHIIENHQRIPLVLIDSQSNTKDATKLCCPVKP
ncbi:B-cell linker protein isoform X2 [Mastacembelus armatus]|uniref:B cell linker n=1 Tax=Mastacembelus armatus TaxID=205130 RepID=A0A3Q3LW81_9TELE|nr:B-cell linker protein-like isoform X2 [Mastacembelus armatus]